MNSTQMRTWAEIRLDNIENNFMQIKARLDSKTRFLGIVKADGYGHGSVPVALRLAKAGCDYLAVATADEAVVLRKNGIALPILILGYSLPENTKTLLDYDITQTVSDLKAAEEMSRIAVSCGKRLRAHLKVDSGMGRLGFICHDGYNPAEEMLGIMRLPGLDIEGIFTHFAVSDTSDGGEYTRRQFEDFSNLIKKLEKESGTKFKIKHCANSGAVMNYKNTMLDMVRPGIALYGVEPGPDKSGIPLLPAMELKTRIAQIKELAPGFSVSYGRTYITKAKRRIAVVPIGYADGLHRVLSNRFEMLVGGKRVPQIGNICMDMCMLDVTDVEGAEVGDIVTVFGRDGDELIPVDELAAAAGTISYEILCSISKRVPRIYL